MSYRDHASAISAEIYERPIAMRDAILFASLSIQQAVINVPAMLDDYRERGLSSDYLWGHKLDCAEWAENNYERIWRLARDGETTARELIWELMACPGLGIVKSAFVAQLSGFDVACLDGQNIKRLGLSRETYRTRGGKHKRSRAIARKLDQYISETSGKAESMWNDWCAYVAPKYKRTAFDISALHLAIIEEG